MSDRKQLFLKTLEAQFGHIAKACRAVPIDRKTYYRWYNDDEDFADRCDDIQESLIDTAESKLHENIRDNKSTDIQFFLKTRGKRRGYIERKEIAGVQGAPLELVATVKYDLARLSTRELEQLESIAKKLERSSARSADGS
jgi:hypothetical protein